MTSGEDLFERLKIVKEATRVASPDFTLKGIDGKPVTLGEFKGKVVFINFWATWCPPCVIEMPQMGMVNREFHSKGLVILAVNYREGVKNVKAFVESHKLIFRNLLEPRGTVSSLYMAWALPVTVIVNKRGGKVGLVIGYQDWDTPEPRAFVRQLLEEQ